MVLNAKVKTKNTKKQKKINRTEQPKMSKQL